MQQRRNPRESRTRVITDQSGCRTGVRRRGLQNDYPRASGRQLAAIAGFGEIRDTIAVGIRQRPDALNERIGIAAKLTAKSYSEFPERNGHAPCQRLTGYLPVGLGAGAGAEAGAFEAPLLATGALCNCARIAGVMSIVGVV